MITLSKHLWNSPAHRSGGRSTDDQRKRRKGGESINIGAGGVLTGAATTNRVPGALVGRADHRVQAVEQSRLILDMVGPSGHGLRQAKCQRCSDESTLCKQIEEVYAALTW